jgi:single-stranded-DNA-specific exonuclease
LESSDCRHCFIRFGGHAHAAGFSLASDSIPTLRDGLERYARERLTLEDLIPGVTIDAELDFSQIDRNLIRSIATLEPFGVGNPRPLFGTRAARMLQPLKIMKEKHAKLRLRDSDAGRPFDAIGWRMREQIEELNLVLGDKLDIAYTIEENTDPDFFGLQLILRDVRRSVAALTTS